MGVPMLDIPSVVPSGSSAMVLEEEDPLLMPWEHFEAIAAMKHCTSCRKNKKLEFFGGMATCDECRPRKARKRAEGRKAKRVLLKVGGQEGAASQQQLKRADEERAKLAATVEEQQRQIVLLEEATGRKPKPCLCGQEAAGDGLACCDTCATQYHPGCVGTTVEALRQIEIFVCPACLQKMDIYLRQQTKLNLEVA